MMKKAKNMVSMVLVGSLLLISLFSPLMMTKSVAATKDGKKAVAA